ncbi:hypothetical protein C7M52_02470 [Mixta theicola]|nr:hypothetical protein C7M52_02470 [Mixta theicola]
MFQFSFGIASLAVAAVMTGAYLAGYCLRHVGAYINRSTPPQERMLWYVGITLVLGLVIGSMLQPYWEKISNCRDYGEPWARCIGQSIINR